MTDYKPVQVTAASKPCSSFPPVFLSSLPRPVTSSQLERAALYLASHTPAVPHYSVNASAELNPPPSMPRMAHLSLLAREVGRTDAF